MTTVRDVMSTGVVTVEPSTLLMDVAVAMSSARVGSAVVMDQGKLVGIFTERDILTAFSASLADPARVTSVSKIMTPDPRTIGPGATVGEAMDAMLDGGFRHLPVIQGEKLVGIVSMRDLARAVTKSPAAAAKQPPR